MGKVALTPKYAKFFIGFISNDTALFQKVKTILIKKFGPTDIESNILEFNSTTYYNKEMGEGLKRKFLSFNRLVNLEDINITKILSNKLEKKFSIEGKRRINIDPGYITLSKVSLLTTKDYYHRIYLGKGIYGEVTLYYKDKTFRPFEWTYPDYKSKDYIDFFNKVREIYALQLTT